MSDSRQQVLISNLRRLHKALSDANASLLSGKKIDNPLSLADGMQSLINRCTDGLQNLGYSHESGRLKALTEEIYNQLYLIWQFDYEHEHPGLRNEILKSCAAQGLNAQSRSRYIQRMAAWIDGLRELLADLIGDLDNIGGAQNVRPDKDMSNWWRCVDVAKMLVKQWGSEPENRSKMGLARTRVTKACNSGMRKRPVKHRLFSAWSAMPRT